MHTYTRRITLAVVAMTVALSLEGRHLFAQAPQPVEGGKDPLVGVWKINLPASRYDRTGKPGPKPPETLTWTYTAEKDGLRMSVYPQGLAPQPARSYFFKWDGKEHPDPQGPGLHESVIFWRMDRRMLTRLVLGYASDEDRAARRNPKRVEWVAWSLSEDEKTLAITAWTPTTPQWQNVQIFDRVAGTVPASQ
jgi:hypothetical protein